MSTFMRLILDGPAFIVNDVVDDEGDGPPSNILSSFIAILAAPYLFAPHCSLLFCDRPLVCSLKS